MNQYPVLVYGTLRPGGSNYSYFLDGATMLETNVRIDGFTMLAGSGYPYLIEGDRTVTATLVYILPEDYVDVMRRLDFLEGFKSEGSNSNHYDRKLVTFDNDGVPTQAWVYVAAPNTARQALSMLPILESGDWIEHAMANRI